jgi:hypothetical protein
MKIDKLDALERVRNRLITRGWITHKLGDPEGPNCLLGAMQHEGVERNLAKAIVDAIRARYDAPPYQRSWKSTITFWNDSQGRRGGKEKVIGLLSELIEKELEKRPNVQVREEDLVVGGD